MNDARSLLIEIGVEELPIHAVDDLARAFAHGVCDGLEKRGIEADTDDARAFATPRRLAVLVPAVARGQAAQRNELAGPYANIALDADGQPTKALLGFANKCGVAWNALERAVDARGERFVHRSVTPGRGTAELVAELLQETVAALPVPRPMRWGDHDFSFVRPVHWLVMLHGDQVIEGSLFGIASGRQSRGHRFLHPSPVHLADADSYLDALRAAKVLADPKERERRITDELANVIGKLRSGTSQPDLCAHIDAGNISEVRNLVEWPIAIACTFDAEYLSVPREALIETMQVNQKFFPVLNADLQLTEHFIGIANVASNDPGQIRGGYERVIRPRFADAKYFFDEDLKTLLAGYQDGLRDVVWQRALGSLWDKSLRVAELSSSIAERLFAQGIEVDAADAARAAGLSRCDLLTRMVGEFPELQGVMGRHYAAAQGEPAAIASALDEFYRPRHAHDGIADGVLAQCVSLADKLDTLAGIFAVGLKPTGNKDPFALRRAALGLARTLIEGGLELELDALLKEAVAQVPETAMLPSPSAASLPSSSAASLPSSSAASLPSPSGRGWREAPGEGSGPRASSEPSPPTPLPNGEGKNAAALRAALLRELRAFILDRLRGYYAEQGFAPQQFEAVAAVHPASLVDFDRRLRAVAAFAARPEAGHLAAANKRVANILRKAGIDMAAATSRPLDSAALREPAEHALAEALHAARADNAKRLEGATPDRDYEAALARLAQLQAPIDAFFDNVMVMADDPALRANRVALLARVKARFDAIADIALL